MSNTYLLVGDKNSDTVVDTIDKLCNDFTTKFSILKIEKYDVESLSIIHNFINSTSLEGDHKILICYNFEECDERLQNKLLKDIEDIHKTTLQIYTTNNINSILSTIVSRLTVININNKIDLSFFNTEQQNIINQFLLHPTDIVLLKENLEWFDIIKYVYAENIDNIFLKYTADSWPKLLCNILINVLYKKYENNIDKIKIINDYEKILKSNASFNLQYEAMLLKLSGE